MQKTQNFYVRSSLFVVLSVVGAGINYLLYPVLSRVLNLSEFGDFATVLGLSNQVMGMLLAFSVISIALVKQFGEAESHDKTQIIQKVLLRTFIGFSAIVLVASPWLQDLFKMQHMVSFLVLALIMILAVPVNVWSGYLQGHKEHVRVGVFTLASAVLKFAFVVGLAATYGVDGGLWGFLLGSLFGILVIFYYPGRKVPRFTTIFKSFTDSEKAFLHSYKGFVFQSVFVVAGLVFLQNYDLNLAKVLFDPETAGVYGGISALSNALYYIIFLMIWVLLPEFSIDNPKNNRRVLRTAYSLTVLLTIAVIVGGLLLGDQVLGLLLGKDFSHGGTVFVVASLFRIALVAVTLYAFYLLVLKKSRALYLAGAVLLSCLILPLFFHATMLIMASSLFVAVLLGAAAYAIGLKVLTVGRK